MKLIEQQIEVITQDLQALNVSWSSVVLFLSGKRRDNLQYGSNNFYPMHIL